MTALVETDLDRLLASFYSAAFELDWTAFRPRALQMLCEASGAAGAAWLTRATNDLPGEYAQWPQEAGFEPDAVRAMRFESGARERELQDLPPALGGYRRALVLSIAHRGSSLHSVLLLTWSAAGHPDTEWLRRAAGHLVQAGTLALSQLVQRDEWLQALGRPSRGCAALVDARGAVYVSSRRFRELIGAQYGDAEFSSLPFSLPADAFGEGSGDFADRGLHFRLTREGRLMLVHVRRPHPLDGLSPREQEIARGLAQGKTFKSVAREYGIAISTVANHASRIYRKLGLYRREDLVGLLRKPNAGQA